MPDDKHLIALWQQALKQPAGLAIPTDDRLLLKQQLYRARAASDITELGNLAIVMPETPENEIWIVRRDLDAPTR